MATKLVFRVPALRRMFEWQIGVEDAQAVIEPGEMANSGAHVFTTPSANSQGAADWVLVLDAASQ